MTLITRITTFTSIWLALLVPLLAQAEFLKLTEVAPGGSVQYAQSLALDGGRALVSADDDGDGVFDLFSVSLAGGDPTRLNEPLADPFNFAFPLALDSSGATVLYGLDGTAGNRLYSVPASGPDTASVRLDLEVAWALDYTRAFISGDGQRVVFEGNQRDENIYELFSVPISGPAGAMVRLNTDLQSGSVSQPVLSADGLTVVYQADQDPVEPGRELYAVAVDGSGGPVQIAGGGSFSSQVKVTDSRAVFWRNNALFSAPLSGPASVGEEISITPVTGDRIRSSQFQVTPDGANVVYFVVSDSGDHLYSVPIDGPAQSGVRLTPDGQDVVEFQLAGSSAVVYDIRREAGGKELYSVPLAGPDLLAVKLNPDFDLSNGGSQTYQVSPDGSRVVFQAALEELSKSELWTVATAGPASASTRLSPTLPAQSDVFFDFVISPDSQRVAYRVDLDANDVFDLYSVAIAGPISSNVKLNGPLASGGDVCANSARCYRFAPDSRRVLFEAEADADFESELFIADDGSAAATFVLPVQTVFEGTTVTLEINLGAPSVLPVTLQLEQTGGTASADDFSVQSTVQFAPGVISVQVPITLVADDELDAGETIELSINNVSNAGVGVPFTAVLTIRPEGEIFFNGFEG